MTGDALDASHHPLRRPGNEGEAQSRSHDGQQDDPEGAFERWFVIVDELAKRPSAKGQDTGPNAAGKTANKSKSMKRLLLVLGVCNVSLNNITT